MLAGVWHRSGCPMRLAILDRPFGSVGQPSKLMVAALPADGRPSVAANQRLVAKSASQRPRGRRKLLAPASRSATDATAPATDRIEARNSPLLNDARVGLRRRVSASERLNDEWGRAPSPSYSVAGPMLLGPNPCSYFPIFVVYQTCGAPFTPAFSIAAFNSGDAANAFAFSRLWNSCETVTSFGLSVD